MAIPTHKKQTAMAPKRSKLGDIYRETQLQGKTPQNYDTDEFEMVPHMAGPVRDDAAPTGLPEATVESTAMDADEPFQAYFEDDSMGADLEDDILAKMDNFGLTKLEMKEQAKKTGAQIILDTSKNRCWNCCHEFKKSDLLPLTPTRLPTSAKWPAYCFGCVQCENEDESWDWMKFETNDKLHRRLRLEELSQEGATRHPVRH